MMNRLEDYEMSYARSLQLLFRIEHYDGVDLMVRAERYAVEREELPEIGYTRFKFEDGSELFL